MSSDKNNKYTAAGSMAGYLFQPDRALLLLAESSRDSTVGVECVDDLSVVNSDGTITLREQDKNTIQSQNETFTNRSRDLWHTLYIWAKAVEDGEIDTEKVKLVCATNVPLSDDLLIKEISKTKTNDDVATLIKKLQQAINNPPKNIEAEVSYIFQRTSILEKTIPCIELSDNNSHDNLDSLIAEKLHLSDANAIEIIRQLKGWLHECIRINWENDKPALIKVETFINVLNQAKFDFHKNQIRIRAKQMVQLEVTDTEKIESKSRLFVQQLEKMSHEDLEEIIMEAIDDFLCSETERTRLALENNVTKEEMDRMDEINVTRWKQVFRRYKTEFKPELTEEELAAVAFKIYDATISGYNALLKNQQVDPYLTNGSFYKMTDVPLMGWHPLWENLFIEK